MITFALASSTPVLAAPPLVFVPAGKWMLAGDDGQCFLSRSFKNGSASLTLRIDQFPLQYGFETRIAFEHGGRGHTRVPTRIGPEAKFEPSGLIATDIYESSDGEHRVYRTVVGPGDLDRASESGVLLIRPARYVGVQLEVRQLADAILALRKCEQLLIEDSGLPPADVKRIKTFPEPNGTIGKQPFYQARPGPEDDLDDVSVARTIIDSKGRPEECVVIHRAKSNFLNTESCRRIMTHTYDPAVDEQGHSVAAPIFMETGWPAD